MRGEFEYKVEDVSASIGEVRKEWGKYLATHRNVFVEVVIGEAFKSYIT